MFFVLAITLLASSAFCLPNGVGLVPALGYNTWNDFRCNITAQDVFDVADAMVRQGLTKVGYEYLVIDDCWAKNRDSNGVIQPDPVGFPNGIAAVADYVHSKGLKFGIYTDRGQLTCQSRPGSLNYEKIDAQTYASWGVDYLKEDSCNATQDHDQAFEEYGRMRDALNSTGRPIYFSLCGWNSWYSPVGGTLGNSWRIAGDCNHWDSIKNAIDVNAPLSKNAKPGQWNDPDMLVGSDNRSAVSITPIRARTMFSLWAVMAAPLLIGSNIRDLNAWDLETYSNTEILAVDQDSLGLQGIRIHGGNLTGGSKTNIWGRKLSDGSYALVFLNDADEDGQITCDLKCFTALGVPKFASFQVRDLWKHQNIGITSIPFTARHVKGRGGSVTLKFTPQ